MRVFALTLIIMAAGTVAAAPAEAPSHMFQGRDIFSLQCVTDPQISPDGHAQVVGNAVRRSVAQVDGTEVIGRELGTRARFQYPTGAALPRDASGGNERLLVRRRLQ